MMGTAMNSIGEERARARRKRVAGVWRDTVAGAMVGGIALGVAARAEDPGVRWALLAVAAAAMAWALYAGIVRYFAVIDEQEKLAAYWSGMVGLYAYAFLYGAQLVAERLGSVVPEGDHWTFWIVSAVTLAAFFWKRYR